MTAEEEENSSDGRSLATVVAAFRVRCSGCTVDHHYHVRQWILLRISALDC